jgi:hypothetical protein
MVMKNLGDRKEVMEMEENGYKSQRSFIDGHDYYT